MTTTITECQHTCKEVCTFLTEAVEMEKQLLTIYTQMKEKCEYPAVHEFVTELILSQQQRVNQIVRKIDELRVQNSVLDSICASFDAE